MEKGVGGGGGVVLLRSPPPPPSPQEPGRTFTSQCCLLLPVYKEKIRLSAWWAYPCSSIGPTGGISPLVYGIDCPRGRGGGRGRRLLPSPSPSYWFIAGPHHILVPFSSATSLSPPQSLIERPLSLAISTLLTKGVLYLYHASIA